MPTYEYKCEACGATFERFQSIVAPPIKKCPTCSKNKVRRLIGTGAGLIFKGSGFYTTDYRSDAYKSAAKNDTSSPKSDAGTKSGAESKSDSAAATPASTASATAKAAPAATAPSNKPAAKAKRD